MCVTVTTMIQEDYLPDNRYRQEPYHFGALMKNNEILQNNLENHLSRAARVGLIWASQPKSLQAKFCPWIWHLTLNVK